MIKSILIPVDGSANSGTAVDYGIYIGPKLGASLVGLNVIDVYLIQGPMMSDVTGTVTMPPYDGFFGAIEESLKEKADKVLQDFTDRCGAAGVACSVKKSIGKISDTIIEEAENADLVLMAKKGEHLHIRDSSIIGSVAEVVIRRSGKPVMVIPPAFGEIESMGLAYDGSSSARKVLELCLYISEKTKWPITTLIINKDGEKAAGLSVEVEDMAAEAQVDCEVIISTGREADVIINFIREGAVELMAMGAYGHNRLRELFLGSTTSQVIRKSTIPVLLMR